jgi:hypothetical protein
MEEVMKVSDPKKEIAELKAENKKLKALLTNAVQLLHKSRDILEQQKKPAAAKPRTKKGKQPRARRRSVTR